MTKEAFDQSKASSVQQATLVKLHHSHWFSCVPGQLTIFRPGRSLRALRAKMRAWAVTLAFSILLMLRIDYVSAARYTLSVRLFHLTCATPCCSFKPLFTFHPVKTHLMLQQREALSSKRPATACRLILTVRSCKQCSHLHRSQQVRKQHNSNV